MPTREQITNEINSAKSSGQDTIRRRYLRSLQKTTGRDTIIYFSAYNIARPFPVPPAALSVTQDDIQGFMAAVHKLKGDSLDLILHSPGGSLDAADQIVQYLRAKYGHIRAIIPQNAMSAATMIACACDEIIMGRHSAVGPIDPQMVTQNGAVPAHAILEEFNRARADIAANPVLTNLWAPRLAGLPPGYISLCEQTINLAVEKVETWLKQYMLGQQQGAKAKEIATWLGNFNEHKTHGRPLGYDLLLNKGLKVKRLEDDQDLQEGVLSIFHAVMHTFQVTACLKIVENHTGKGHYLVANVQAQGPQLNAPTA